LRIFRLRENPAAKIKPRQVLQKSPEVFDDQEVAGLLRHAGEVERAVLLCLFFSGMREQEICHLGWEDVDFRKKLLHVSAKPDVGFTPKTWEERTIEMSDQLSDTLRNRRRNPGGSFPQSAAKSTPTSTRSSSAWQRTPRSKVRIRTNSVPRSSRAFCNPVAISQMSRHLPVTSR
jgi:integrase